jgi:protein required for attachment to host cells
MTHQKLAHGAWVFVGDDQKALFLINEGDEMFPNLRRLLVEEHKDPPSREQGTDAPGRAYSSVGEIRSAVESTDWHELEKERFAASIAERINKAALSNEFNQIENSRRPAARVRKGNRNQNPRRDPPGSHASYDRGDRRFGDGTVCGVLAWRDERATLDIFAGLSISRSLGLP